MPSEANSLWIFNPDTDYALASNRRYYTPPASVIELRKKLALTFLPIARPGYDAILLLDTFFDDQLKEIPNYSDVISSEIELVNINQIKSAPDKWRQYTPRPWGWNKSLHTLLIESVGNMNGLPDETKLNNIRQLSHRRTSIIMLKALKKSVCSDEISIPTETSVINDILKRYQENRNLFIKAPWSSSGRGIIYTGDLEIKHIEPWVKGIIRKQGSIIIENAYNRKLDFASEWYIENGIAEFLGFSVFNVSNRGKYHSNVIGNQKDLLSIIESNSNWNNNILTAQKAAIEFLIAPFYSGPMGIDMLATQSGAINPCVEINLRYTMGHIALFQENKRLPLSFNI